MFCCFFQSILSAINLYPGGKDDSRLNNSKVVSFTFYELDAKKVRTAEYSVKNMTTGKEISVVIPITHSQLNRRIFLAEAKLYLSKYDALSFEIKDNMSAVTVEVTLDVPVDVEIYVRVDREPNPSQHLFDFNATFSANDDFSQSSVANSLNSTIKSYSHRLLLTNDVLNWTAAGKYFAKVLFKKPNSLVELTDDKLTDEIQYNFSVYRSGCLFYDKRNHSWATEGVKVMNLTYQRPTLGP